MTTPDPAPGSGPAPDDATTTYDAEAARGPASPPASPPLPPSDPAPLPPPSAAPWPPGAVPPPGALPPPGAVPPPRAEVPPAIRPARSTPPGLVAGVILVIIGAALLVSRVVDLSLGGVTWPVWIVVPGVAMLVGSFFIPPRGGLGLAIPGAIVTMVGMILWVQEVYDLYATWAYAWALVAPTGPGLGMLLYGLVHRDRELVGDGTRMTLVGIGLFLGFMLFFEGVLGLSGAPIANLDEILPYAAIGLGVLLVVLSFVGGRRGPGEQARR